MNYSTIKSIAKEQGIRVDDLCALAPKNDPFYTGRPAQVVAAEWFAELWERFGYGHGVHLRRVHYQVVSQDPPVLRPNGEVYENSVNDWTYLSEAGKWARYLGLVDPAAFVDRRNPEAMIFTNWHSPDDWDYSDPTPRYSVAYDRDEWGFYLPELPTLPSLRWWLPHLPDFDVDGYDEGIQQDYHVEVWCEKTTMNDVLEPLCREYNVNLITGAGELSITAVVNFMRRVRDAERAARVLYVSDYDPAGLGMPISIARKIEFFQRRNGDAGLDIRLQPVVLTSEQVADYSLPRVPVKDTDRRKAHWERDHGAGQVELDALEALHPRELERIVREAILDYYDPTLGSRAREQRVQLAKALGDCQREVLDCYQEARGELEADYSALRGDFGQLQGEFAELVADFQERIDAYQRRLGSIKERGWKLYEEICDDLNDVDVDIDHYPLPTPDLPSVSDVMLYASERGYVAQLVAYKAYRHGSGEVVGDA